MVGEGNMYVQQQQQREMTNEVVEIEVEMTNEVGEVEMENEAEGRRRR